MVDNFDPLLLEVSLWRSVILDLQNSIYFSHCLLKISDFITEENTFYVQCRINNSVCCVTYNDMNKENLLRVSVLLILIIIPAFFTKNQTVLLIINDI